MEQYGADGRRVTGTHYACPLNRKTPCGNCGARDGHRFEALVFQGMKVPDCPLHQTRLIPVRR